MDVVEPGTAIVKSKVLLVTPPIVHAPPHTSAPLPHPFLPAPRSLLARFPRKSSPPYARLACACVCACCADPPAGGAAHSASGARGGDTRACAPHQSAPGGWARGAGLRRRGQPAVCGAAPRGAAGAVSVGGCALCVEVWRHERLGGDRGSTGVPACRRRQALAFVTWIGHPYGSRLVHVIGWVYLC
eukprot:356081-Chlamydomonas_euryale.AAC.4